MLQSMEQPQPIMFLSKRNIDINKVLPKVKHADAQHSICSRCRFVNEALNNFCTNCGYPVKEKETSALYHVRMKQRKELLRKGEKAVQAARVVLYILSVLLLTGIGLFIWRITQPCFSCFGKLHFLGFILFACTVELHKTIHCIDHRFYSCNNFFHNFYFRRVCKCIHYGSWCLQSFDKYGACLFFAERRAGRLLKSILYKMNLRLYNERNTRNIYLRGMRQQGETFSSLLS
jgi:ribosomal protein L37E